MNDLMSKRDKGIVLLSIRYDEHLPKVERMFNHVDKSYGNTLSEREKFTYVKQILEKKRTERDIDQQFYPDDLTSMFYETGTSRGIELIPSKWSRGESLKYFRSSLDSILKNI